MSRAPETNQSPSSPYPSRGLRAGLRLLMTRGDVERPEVVLPQGMPLSSLDGAPPPTVAPVTESRQAFGDSSRDASLLSERHWGVVVPTAEPLRSQLLSAVQPLLTLRAEQQGSDLQTLLRQMVYSVPSDPDLPLGRAVEWYRRAILEEDLAEEVRRTELDRPDYLLLLGDLHQVPESVAQVLSSFGHFVGRLAFTEDSGQPRLADYRRYAEKAVAAVDNQTSNTYSDEYYNSEEYINRPESSGSALDLVRRARLLYVQDGSEATELSQELLIRPLLSRLALPNKKGTPRDLNSAPGAALHKSDDLLHAAAQLPASLLFSVGHGYGGPRAGFGSVSEQRRWQGALSFPNTALRGGAASRRLSAEDLRAAAQPFVAGGIWFMLACYGAGTPAESLFYHWLAQRSGQLDDEARWVLRSLPAPASRVPDSRPFIAALPQAALAQPDGPLAIIGHLDLAWSYSFVDGGEDESADSALSRGDYDHFETFVRSLMRRARVGPAFTSLTRKRRSAEQSLLRRYDALRRSQMLPKDAATPSAGQAGRTAASDEALRRHFMTRQDLMGYVILGDPAVRLPTTGGGDRRMAASPMVIAQSAPSSPAAGERAETSQPASTEGTVAAAAIPAVQGASEARTLAASAPASLPSEPSGSGADVLRLFEDAVLQLTLAGGDALAEAVRLGVSGPQLEALARHYHRAGRAALATPKEGT